jgi:uncharacterized protein
MHFGLLASAQAVQLEQMQLGFLRQLVTDCASDWSGSRVKPFVMGDNVWRDEDEWPLARSRWERWYLHADGSLSPAAPQPAPAASHFSYDPSNPVPTVGGPTLISGGPGGGVGWMGGPRDQRVIEGRPDVLSFTSPTLTGSLEVTVRSR